MKTDNENINGIYKNHSLNLLLTGIKSDRTRYVLYAARQPDIAITNFPIKVISEGEFRIIEYKA